MYSSASHSLSLGADQKDIYELHVLFKERAREVDAYQGLQEGVTCGEEHTSSTPQTKSGVGQFEQIVGTPSHIQLDLFCRYTRSTISSHCKKNHPKLFSICTALLPSLTVTCGGLTIFYHYIYGQPDHAPVISSYFIVV